MCLGSCHCFPQATCKGNTLLRSGNKLFLATAASNQGSGNSRHRGGGGARLLQDHQTSFQGGRPAAWGAVIMRLWGRPPRPEHHPQRAPRQGATAAEGSASGPPWAGMASESRHREGGVGFQFFEVRARTHIRVSSWFLSRKLDLGQDRAVGQLLHKKRHCNSAQ